MLFYQVSLRRFYSKNRTRTTTVCYDAFSKLSETFVSLLVGFIETPMVETVPENIMGVMTMLTPLGRIGQPEGTIPLT